MTYAIVSNPESMTITVGPKVFTEPVLWRMAEMASGYKEEICGPSPANDIKGRNQFYCSLLGPKFNRRFQAANYWLWLGERMQQATANMLRHDGMRWRVYAPELVIKANRALAYVNEAEGDGLHHLIPAIVVFEASPQAIRKHVGPATWRAIAHNSRTRNTKLMQATLRAGRDEWGECFVRLLDFPSGVLGGVQIADDDEVMAARLSPRKHAMAFLQTVHTIRDARRMLGDVNPAWGMARIRREHDAAVRDRRSKRYSAKAFTSDWSHEAEGFTATLFTSPLEIAVEGDTQHHCVGSYASMAERGDYAVIRIEGKERATAGYRKEKHGWCLDQVYGSCNAAVGTSCRGFAIAAGAALSLRDFARKAA